jgi:hypothetical protein
LLTAQTRSVKKIVDLFYSDKGAPGCLSLIHPRVNQRLDFSGMGSASPPGKMGRKVFMIALAPKTSVGYKMVKKQSFTAQPIRFPIILW